MKYYATFTPSNGEYAVSFPDLKGCHTCGKDMEEAYDMAIDALSAWLAHAEPQFIKKPSPYKAVKKHFSDVVVMAVPVDWKVKAKYEEKRRVNVSFPRSVLDLIDEQAKSAGIGRSGWLAEAARAYAQSDQATLNT